MVQIKELRKIKFGDKVRPYKAYNKNGLRPYGIVTDLNYYYKPNNKTYAYVVSFNGRAEALFQEGELELISPGRNYV